MRGFDRDLIRGGHYGQRSCEPRSKAAYFETFEENSHMLPKFYGEASKDLEDTIDFYNLSFSQLSKGEAKSTRVFRIPE